MTENIVFIVDEKIEKEGRKFNFIDAGIHENIELTEVKVEKSPTGKDFLSFTFTSADGKELVKTEWKPTVRDDQGHDVLITKCQNQANRVRHIMKKFMEESLTKVEYDYNNWVKFASAVKAKLDPVKHVTKVRIKATYDNNNWVSLPNYLPFIESMAVPAADSILEIGSIDKMTRDVADTEKISSNPFEETTTDPMAGAPQTPIANDLPF